MLTLGHTSVATRHLRSLAARYAASHGRPWMECLGIRPSSFRFVLATITPSLPLPTNTHMHACNPLPPSTLQDLVSRMFEFCSATASRAAAVAVGRAADVIQALVPDSTPRIKIETAVKGGLTLVALALLKSVLSVSAFSGDCSGFRTCFVRKAEWRAQPLGSPPASSHPPTRHRNLTLGPRQVVLAVGAAALALYTVTQVFGWELIPGTSRPIVQPRSAPPTSEWPSPPTGYPAGWNQQGYGQQQQPQPNYGQPQYGQPQPQQQQQSAAWQWQPSFGDGGPAPSAPPMPQGDVVDVWYGGGSAGNPK